MIVELLAAAANPGFDVDTATTVYLDTLQGAARAKSDAYFEGGYWLTLWGAAILLTGYMLLATPATNTLIRVQEAAADAFGLDAAQEPDGFAQAAMRLSEYRKIEPSAFEEAMFFDHPSGATRVRGSMQWKKDHVPNATIVHLPAGYLGGR